MPKQEDIRHSILIVSGSEQFEATVRRALKGFLMVDTRKSAAMPYSCSLLFQENPLV